LRFITVGPGQPSIAAECRWKAQGATGDVWPILRDAG
jgi:hypothetical protein